MVINHLKLRASLGRGLLLALTLLLLIMVTPGRAEAQWPPFRFDLEPAHHAGQVTYRLSFSSQLDGPLTDLLIKIPLPAGTRFVQAGANPATAVDFDGAEITFFTATYHKSIKDAFFIVETTNPTITTVSARAWISWKGAQPGDYLTDDFVADLTAQPLNWHKPDSRLQLETRVLVAGSTVTYAFYPVNQGRLRMWDLHVNMPLPAGASFLSVDAPPPFATGYNGQEVSFAITELPQDVSPGPLKVTVAINDPAAPLLTTTAWAGWKNAGKKVGLEIPAQETYHTGPINVTPFVTRQAAIDTAGDVPFPNYDLTGLTLQQAGPALDVIFHTLGPIGQVGEPVEFIFYIDQDCQVSTGQARSGRGAEYRLRYRHSNARLDTHQWAAAAQSWERLGGGFAAQQVTAAGSAVSIRLPAALAVAPQFCWLGEAKYRTTAYTPSPPTDRLPDSRESEIAQFELSSQ